MNKRRTADFLDYADEWDWFKWLIGISEPLILWIEWIYLDGLFRIITQLPDTNTTNGRHAVATPPTRCHSERLLGLSLSKGDSEKWRISQNYLTQITVYSNCKILHPVPKGPLWGTKVSRPRHGGGNINRPNPPIQYYYKFFPNTSFSETTEINRNLFAFKREMPYNICSKENKK